MEIDGSRAIFPDPINVTILADTKMQGATSNASRSSVGMT
jgi:hypothetical protein